MTVDGDGVAAGGARAGSRDGQPFDLAILDMHMPELDGIALATAIRASEVRTRATPVVILSSLGDARPGDARRSRPFLVKPVKPSALHDTLATVLAGEATSVPVRCGRRPGSTASSAHDTRSGSSSPRTTR